MSAEDLASAPAFRMSDLIRHGAEPPPVALFTRWRSYPWLIVGVCCIGGFMGQIDASIVQLALPTLGRVFDATLESVSWVALGLSLGCRGVHADLRPALSDLWQEAALHHRLRRVHFRQRALRLRAGSRHFGCLRFLQGVGGAMLGANSLALVVVATDKSRRGEALGVYAAAQAVGVSAGPVVGRTAARDIGLALGVLDQCSLRADLDRRRLAGASGDSTARSEPNFRLARRSPARACADVRGVRAQSGFGAGTDLASAPRLCRRRNRPHLSVRQAGRQIGFADGRSCAAQGACVSGRRACVRAFLRHAVRHVLPRLLRSHKRLPGQSHRCGAQACDRSDQHRNRRADCGRARRLDGYAPLQRRWDGDLLCGAARADSGRDGAHSQSLGRLLGPCRFRDRPRRVHCAKQPCDDQCGRRPTSQASPARCSI